ncbi:DUF397 domain-containing protein [Allosalinactinospora lopnorensis]|uniref:DUF397 domain-containing protein n=1 Tax=Allosalinactinospora lopnorensis TaxID=1352348 RepID=UPI000623F0AE|nr:DUF397 domain-containing protein [Allosalinactinospora lopnorensis]
MAALHDRARAQWRKSTHSTNGGDCVEASAVDGTAVAAENKTTEEVMFALRDSKNPDQPALVFTRAEWDAFVAGVKDGEFDAETLLAAMKGRVLVG